MDKMNTTMQPPIRSRNRTLLVFKKLYQITSQSLSSPSSTKVNTSLTSITIVLFLSFIYVPSCIIYTYIYIKYVCMCIYIWTILVHINEITPCNLFKFFMLNFIEWVFYNLYMLPVLGYHEQCFKSILTHIGHIPRSGRVELLSGGVCICSVLVDKASFPTWVVPTHSSISILSA